jgi:hypothetical protein
MTATGIDLGKFKKIRFNAEAAEDAHGAGYD